jgi:hypothetical protein
MWVFLAAMVLESSYTLLCCAAFIGGSVTIPLIGTMVLYVTEMSTNELVTVCTGIAFLAEALTSVAIGLYFQYFKDAAVFFFIISTLLTIFSATYAAFARESPHFLFKSGRYAELSEHL